MVAERTADDPDNGDPDDGGDPTLALIAAVAENRVIGVDGGMPWHYPDDLRHFKETTVGHPVIMGRTTYESIVDRIDGPLPDRRNVVLSRSDLDLPNGVVQATDIDEAIALAREAASELNVDTTYVVGGASVYEATLDRADRLVLTEIHESYEGDTWFPAWSSEEWVEVERDDREELSFVTYERRR